MSTQILRYELDPKIYRISSNSSPHKATLDQLVIYERFKLNQNYEKLGGGFGDYQIIIESEVKSDEQLQNRHFKISSFVSELDKSWLYVCGHPITKKDFAFMTPYVHFPDGKLPGWKSNYSDVEKELHKGKAHVTFSIHSMHNASYAYWPLEKAITTRKRYLKGSEQAKALIDLHYFSHKVESGYAMLFFLAKSLELVRSLLPGKDTAAKEKKLPETVRNSLQSPFNYILGLSNTRYEIRHIVKDSKSTSLHPKMTNSEFNTFKHDADLIIRAVVCMELDIPLLILHRK